MPLRAFIGIVVVLAVLASGVAIIVPSSQSATEKKPPNVAPYAKPKAKHGPKACRNVHLRQQISEAQIVYNRYRRLRGLAPASPREPSAAAGCAYVRWTAETWKARAWQQKRAYRGGIVHRLERGLRGSPMFTAAESLEKQGRRYGVSPFFMAAVAATESSLGAAACANNRFNVWGLANCDGRWHVPSFGSWDEAIGFYANFLKSRWPSATSPYHYTGYAACDSCWGRKTAWWMSRLFGMPPITVYE